MVSIAQVRGAAPYISIKLGRSLTDWAVGRGGRLGASAKCAGSRAGSGCARKPASPESQGRDAVTCTWRQSTERRRYQVSAARMNAGSAEAALQGVMLAEGSLQRAQRFVARQALDGDELASTQV